MYNDNNPPFRRHGRLTGLFTVAVFHACLYSPQAVTESPPPPLLSSPVAANIRSVQNGLFLYQARFAIAKGYGELLAIEVNPNSGQPGETAWEAGKRIGTPEHRNIVTWNPEQQQAQLFAWEQLTGAQQGQLNVDPAGEPDNLGQKRLHYLRGDRSQEQARGGPFRDRVSLLGTIVNAAPVFAGGEDFGYAGTAADPENTYSSYLDAKKRRDGMLYVGANDGMLHGFDTDGNERFAFVPDGVYPHLAELTMPDYQHRYYVDGPPAVADARINGIWRSILVGSLGAGGKSLFAIDVTHPDRLDAQSVLWEVTHPELGYVLGQPAIVPLNNGEWGVIVGNGHAGDADSAQLFVLRLRDGALIRRIDTGSAGANGLSPVAVYDAGFDRVVDRAYAGDLQGNLWVFDLSSEQPSGWQVRHRPQSLYVAEDVTGKVQPITAAPRVARSSDGYAMIFFGTGRYFERGDATVHPDDPINSFYAIKDMDGAFRGREMLTRHAITHQQAFAGQDVRVVRQTSEPGTHGWYLDLIHGGIQTGERVLFRPELRGRRVLFTTLIPPSADNPDGGGFLMELDAESGNPPTKPAFDLARDGTFTLVPGSPPDEDGNQLLASPAGIGMLQGGIPSPPTLLDARAGPNPEDCPGDSCPCPPDYRHCTIMNINIRPSQILQITRLDSLDGRRQMWRQIR